LNITNALIRTPGLLEHSLRTFYFTRAVIDSMPDVLISRQQAEDLLQAAMYHDLGKSTWRNEWFSLPRYSIRNVDWTVMQTHPIQAINMLQSHTVPITDGCKTIILQHHERPGGKGYPHGIEPDLPSVIFAAVDVFCGCIETRAYRDYPLSTEQAFREVARFAPEIVISALKHSIKKLAA